EHMAQGGQRVPHTTMRLSKGPKNGLAGYSTINIRVFGDVNIVVVVDKLVVMKLRICNKSGQCQSQISANNPIFI
ncbi:MAG: hypothetical protein ACYS0C_09640, partial [Planctomycetota bacterium]